MRLSFSCRFLVCCCFIIALALPSFGQRRDTVFAVHKLFREKRAGGAGYSIAADTAISSKQYARQPHSQPTAQEARQDVLASATFATVGLLKAERFSPEREAAILEAYALGNPIPPDIRRKLRRKHFHLSARDLAAHRCKLYSSRIELRKGSRVRGRTSYSN